MSASFKLGLVALLTVFAGTASASKTLVYCSEGSPEGFNPAFFSTGTTYDASSVPIFDRLVAFAPGTTQVVPSLAQSWEVSKNGLVYTFHLRHGVKFQSNALFTPSRDFDADDVLFTFLRQMDPKQPLHRLSAGQTFAYWQDMGMDQIVARIEKLDPYTVRFTLRHPEAPFLADLAMDFASIDSAEYYGKMQARGTPGIADEKVIGTGPFQLVSYQKDAVIRYQAFDQYWRGRAKIDHLIFAITPDAAVRYAKLKTGECQVMAYPNPADIAAMKKDPNIVVYSKAGLNIGYIALNVEKKPLDRLRVRRALALAIDKGSILKLIYQGNAQAAKNLIPPTLWSYNHQVEDTPYDPARARALLVKAGLPQGFAIDLWYLPVSRPYNPDGKRMAELIQADWARIGVRARLVTYEWGEYLKRSKDGEQQAIMYGWSGDNGDPDNFFTPLAGCAAVQGGGNVARWCNKDFERLIQAAKISTNQAQRAKLYERAQAIMKQQMPLIPIAHSLEFTPVRKEVLGYTMDATAHHNFYGVDLAR